MWKSLLSIRSGYGSFVVVDLFKKHVLSVLPHYIKKTEIQENWGDLRNFTLRFENFCEILGSFCEKSREFI